MASKKGLPVLPTLMSKKDKDLLEKSRVKLIEHIRIEDGLLLGHLRSRKAITDRQEDEITSKGDKAGQVGYLLDVLRRGDSNNIDKLVYSLEATGQRNVSDEWLRAPTQLDDWWHMDGTGPAEKRRRYDTRARNFLSDEDKELLERSRPHLMSELRLADGRVLAQLRGRGIIIQPEEDLIKTLQEHKGSSVAVGQLVNLILQKTPDSFDGFIHSLNKTGHSNIVNKHLRQPTTTDTFCPEQFVKEDCLSTKLEDALRVKLGYKLNEWKTALEEGSGGQELLQYIDQPCTVKTKGAEQSTVKRAIQVVEESKPGDRIVVYGEAGAGKTTLLKELSRSWIEKKTPVLDNKFKYFFLIPCRLIGDITLLNLICDELKLIPKSSMSELEKSLDLNETKSLFLIDSYEELRRDVARADKTDINDLISGRLWPKSTVIVTSRPDSTLRQSEHQKTVHLKDLPEEKVKDIIREQFCEDEDAANRVLQSFPAMSFLQKPINLALFLYIVQHSEPLQNIVSFTQAELFSQVLQFNMLAFTKKKKWEEFTPRPSSYIMNREIPIDTRSRFREIAKKCFEERKQNNVVLHIDESDEVSKYLEFGLFTAGPDTNSVLLPHRLFQEYFAAAYLAENPGVWAALFAELKQKSESGSDKRSLVNVLRPMGLNNVIRFLVALKPQVCQQIAQLFVVERKSIIDYVFYQPVNFQYYTELVRDCGDKNGKRVLATALVNAPVRDQEDEHWDAHEDGDSGSIVLWPHLTDDQRVTFLRKVYNFDMHQSDDGLAISCTGQSRRIKISDEFLIAFICLYGCIIINTDNIVIKGDLPASMLSRNIPTVRHLNLECCTLCEGLPDYMSNIDRSGTSQPSSPCPPTNSSLERVVLFDVKGLEYCDVITSCLCQLVMGGGCGDVRASALKTCFPKLSEISLSDTAVVNETEEELTSWLSSVQTVESLKLAPQHEGGALNLCRLLNILAGRKKLRWLGLNRYMLLLGVRSRDTSDTVKQSKTLSILWLIDCKGDVHLDQLLEVCSRQCPQLEMVTVGGFQLQVNVRKTTDTVKQNNTLIGLELKDCKGDVDLRQLLGVCSRQCPHLEWVTVLKCQLQVRVRDGDIVEQNNTLTGLTLQHCKGVMDLGQLLEVCSRQCPQLRTVRVYNSNLVFNYDKIESFKQQRTSRRFKLILRESSVHTAAGRKLSVEEVKRMLMKINSNQC